MNINLTEAEIKTLIDKMLETYQDKYEFYFTLNSTEQATILDQLLNAFPAASENSKKDISKGAVAIVKSFWCYFGEFTNTLVKHPDKSPADDAVLAMINSGIFCQSLLESMQKFKLPNEKWKQWIAECANGKKFKETNADTNMDRLYKEINDLLNNC